MAMVGGNVLQNVIQPSEASEDSHITAQSESDTRVSLTVSLQKLVQSEESRGSIVKPYTSP